jgi:exosortase C (VPDSG-CTERM-specific)
MGFGLFSGAWIALFSLVLIPLIRFSLGSELESYIPLIPFISLYLLVTKKPREMTDHGTVELRRSVATGLGIVAVILLVVHGVLISGGRIGGNASVLVLPVVAFVTGLLGGAVFCFGWPAFRSALFPWVFLYLMTPFPEPVAHWMRVALQQGSAEAAALMFTLTGTSVFRDGLSFQLPGLVIQVAEECSGIHSSLVLVITSLVAGHLFLQKNWTRLLLVAVVIPLGLIRNGFRIVSISLLTIHVDPGIIDSPLHHRGGPVYFVLSLAVLALILWGLRRIEGRKKD